MPAVAAIGAVSVPEQDRRAATSTATCAPRGRRKAWFGAWRDVDVYALDDLKPRQSLAGPAIIEAETTTVVINEGDTLSVNPFGWLDISVGKARSALP